MLSLCAGIFGNIVANRSVGIVSLCAQKYLHIGTSRITDEGGRGASRENGGGTISLLQVRSYPDLFDSMCRSINL